MLSKLNSLNFDNFVLNQLKMLLGRMYGIQIYSFDELSSSKNLLTSEDQRVLVGGCTKREF